MDWHLLITDGAGGSQRRELEGGQWIVGRSVEADLRLDLPTVSRKHARLSHTDGRWVIEDLGSRSGTLVNGEAVRTHTLSIGDTVQISRFTLRLIGRPTPKQIPETVSTWSRETRAPEISMLGHGAAPAIDLSHITDLNALGRHLMEIKDPAARLHRLCETVSQTVCDGWPVLALRVVPDDLSRPPVILGANASVAGKQQDVHLSRTTISAMCERGVPVLASNCSADDAVVEMSIVAENRAEAVVACPLSDGAGEWEVLYATLAPRYATTQWLAIISLAAKEHQQAEAYWRERFAAEQRAALQRDLANARTIQRSILPDQAQVDGLDIAWDTRPCEAIGGDHLDVLPLPDGRVLIMIADVSGHGLPSALATLSVHSVVHTAVNRGASLEQAVTALNDHLCRFLPPGRFVTMFAAVIDPATGQTQSVSAGHDPPIVFRPDGSTRPLHAGHHLILAVEPTEFPSEPDTLEPGDTLLLFTDGLTELRKPDGEMLRVEGLTQRVAAHHAQGADAQGLVQALREEIDQMQNGSPSLDDQTLMIVRRT